MYTCVFTFSRLLLIITVTTTSILNRVIYIRLTIYFLSIHFSYVTFVQYATSKPTACGDWEL